ncbi:hypothetical protein MRQ86_32055 [Streptomyces sp. MMS21 TC-5]|uniref:hypothetical protein n=1 Tax=Streptomyces sp. MMS21 TC-5 TaxID=2925833 RepID=UPI001F61AC32|nr:hypothetical protein [Streptomyces sp. MMS21 TC-5]MCI4084862.1 hypothetical protein [Streptomyces sp. MMS21 TC-5]
MDPAERAAHKIGTQLRRPPQHRPHQLAELPRVEGDRAAHRAQGVGRGPQDRVDVLVLEDGVRGAGRAQFPLLALREPPQQPEPGVACLPLGRVGDLGPVRGQALGQDPADVVGDDRVEPVRGLFGDRLGERAPLYPRTRARVRPRGCGRSGVRPVLRAVVVLLARGAQLVHQSGLDPVQDLERQQVPAEPLVARGTEQLRFEPVVAARHELLLAAEFGGLVDQRQPQQRDVGGAAADAATAVA